MEKLELQNITGSVIMKKSLAVPPKVKHGITLWPSNSIPRYILKRIQKGTQTLVHECL